jgi:cytochrome d ubiquinol oxidase subunit I
MRVMAYLGSLILLFALWGAWLLYRHKLDGARWFLRVAPWVVILPFLINTAGWMLTENGRQPWIVQGLMLTKNGVSSSVSATELWISLVVFYLIYAVLGVAAAWLMIRYGRRSLGDDPLAKITSEGDSGPDSTGTSSTDAESVPSHEDEDDLALVY